MLMRYRVVSDEGSMLTVLPSCLQVDVRIIEPQGLRFVRVPNSLGDHFAGITTISQGEKKVTVKAVADTKKLELYNIFSHWVEDSPSACGDQAK